MKQRITPVLIILAAYVGIFLLCKNFDIGRTHYMYTPSWTLRHVLWISAAISVIPALGGYWRFSYISLAGYTLGVIFGELLGGFQSDVPPQFLHYGWLIWLCIFVLSSFIGLFVEIKHKRALDLGEPSS